MRRCLALALVPMLAIAPALPALAGKPRATRTAEPVRPITIVVNGDLLHIGAAPQVQNGRVLLPLRELFDALGIGVTRSGNTITAQLPTGIVRMNVGSKSVMVNERNVELDTPVVNLNGTAYAPLQLLVAAFSAQATYDQRGAKVEIVSAYVGRSGDAQQERVGGGSDVQGVVSAVDRDSSPSSITVVHGGTSRTISLNSGARIWTEDVTIHAQLRGTFSDVHVGDAVHAILARDGRVVSVFDFFKSTSGTIVATSPSAFVMHSGRVVTPGGSTEISLNGAAAKLAELKTGDYVTVRSNPESGELRAIVASRSLPVSPQTAAPAPGSAPPVTISTVELSTDRPLRAGQSFDVVLHGTPGGRATFDIGDYLTNLEMRESAPGTYDAHFAVPERFNVTQVPVYGNLSVGGVSAPRAESARTLSVATTPPRIEEVAPIPRQTVNNPRPSIFATFSAPTNIAINASSVRLEVNGHDVTSSATRTGGFIVYPPGVDLAEGPVEVVVRVSDAAGNTATRSWNFTVKTR
ncbi:MAG: stalk domain-containing protein [Candidatus Eremiobacteraeota bacterium]|nr:stalk domain-containing protein [Candidatus Eremiobacteraeota bacterium]